jgi:hypothetical protein
MLFSLIIGLLGSAVAAYAGEETHTMDHTDTHYEEPYEQPHSESSHEQPAPTIVPQGTTSSPDAPTSWAPTTSEPPPQETPFRGNWFKKRAILQEMRVSQEALHKMVQEAWIPDHKKFRELYEPAVTQISELQKSLGFEEHTINELEEQLASLPITSPISTTTHIVPPSQIMPTAAFNKDSAIKLLQEMRESLQLMHEIQVNAEKALQQAKQQEPLGPTIDQEAWKHYEEVDAAYDDQRAAVLYEQMRTSEDYLKKLHEYLVQRLSPYINHLVGRFDATLQHIETVYNALLKQGIILRKSDIPSVKPVPPAPTTPHLTWWQKLLSWIMAPFYAIARWVKR